MTRRCSACSGSGHNSRTCIHADGGGEDSPEQTHESSDNGELSQRRERKKGERRRPQRLTWL